MIDLEALLQNLSHRVGIKALGEFLNMQKAKTPEVEVHYHPPKQGVFVISVNIPGLSGEQRKTLKAVIEGWTKTGFLREMITASKTIGYNIERQDYPSLANLTALLEKLASSSLQKKTHFVDVVENKRVTSILFRGVHPAPDKVSKLEEMQEFMPFVKKMKGALARLEETEQPLHVRIADVIRRTGAPVNLQEINF